MDGRQVVPARQRQLHRRDTYSGELTTPISLNRYTYAHNNPLLYMDPDGRRVVVSSGEDNAYQGAQSLAVANASAAPGR